MSNESIQKQIEYYQNLIEEISDPTSFTLNPKIREYNDEIKHLQDMCVHEFNEGKCIYCGKHDGSIIMYSTPTCPKCKVLAKKFEQKGYTVIKEMDEDLLKSLGITSVPQVIINGDLYDFSRANTWINQAPEAKK